MTVMMFAHKRPSVVASVDVLQLIPSVYASSNSVPATAVSAFSMYADGTANGSAVALSGSLVFNWLVSGTASLYEVYVSPTSGSFTAGTVNTWLPMTTARQWYVSATTVGPANTCVFNVKIRRISDSVEMVADTSFTVSASVYADAGGEEPPGGPGEGPGGSGGGGGGGGDIE